MTSSCDDLVVSSTPSAALSTSPSRTTRWLKTAEGFGGIPPPVALGYSLLTRDLCCGMEYGEFLFDEVAVMLVGRREDDR